MTSALRGREGGWSKRDDSTDRLREWDSDKGERVQKSQIFADVICERSLGSIRRENFDGGREGGENRLNFKPRGEVKRGETQYEENISAILSSNKNGKGETGPDASSIYVTGIFVRSLDPISGKVIYQFIQSIFGRACR